MMLRDCFDASGTGNPAEVHVVREKDFDPLKHNVKKSVASSALSCSWVFQQSWFKTL